MADPSQRAERPKTGMPSSTSSSRTNAPARRAISWHKCRSILPSAWSTRLRPGNSTELLSRAVSQRGSDRGRFVAGYVAAGPRAAATMHVRRGRSLDLDAGQGTDLLFGNAVFQWVPDHPKVLARLLRSLSPGGVLAVQMPDNTNEPALMLMEKVAASGPWTAAIVQAKRRNDLPRPEGYYDLLRPLCSRIDIWHTHYNHIIENHAGVVEWFKGSGLRPFLAPLDAAMRETFTAKYTDEIRLAYPARSDGKVMLKFPRLFILAVR